MEWANSFFNLCYTVTCLTLTSQWCRWSDDDRTYLSVKIPNTENACKISFFRFCSVGRLPLEKMVWTNLTRLDEPYQTVWHSSQSVHKWSMWLIIWKISRMPLSLMPDMGFGVGPISVTCGKKVIHFRHYRAATWAIHGTSWPLLCDFGALKIVALHYSVDENDVRSTLTRCRRFCVRTIFWPWP